MGAGTLAGVSAGGVTAAVEGAGCVSVAGAALAGAGSDGATAAAGAGSATGGADLSVSGSALVVCGTGAVELFAGGKYVVVAPLPDVSELVSACAATLPAEQNAKTPKLKARRAESLFISQMAPLGEKHADVRYPSDSW